MRDSRSTPVVKIALDPYFLRDQPGLLDLLSTLMFSYLGPDDEADQDDAYEDHAEEGAAEEADPGIRGIHPWAMPPASVKGRRLYYAKAVLSLSERCVVADEEQILKAAIQVLQRKLDHIRFTSIPESVEPKIQQQNPIVPLPRAWDPRSTKKETP